MIRLERQSSGSRNRLFRGGTYKAGPFLRVEGNTHVAREGFAQAPPPSRENDMTSEELIESVRVLVEKACAAESNVFGYGIWTHHIQHVAATGRELAPIFGADPEIVEIAALLHDYASVKDKSLYADHHIHGPIEAERILTQFGYPQDRIDQVKHAIEAHRASEVVERRSAEAECLANADAITHIRQIPSLLNLAYRQHDMGIDDGAKWVMSKLERSWGKLIPEMKRRTQGQYQAARRILSAGREV